MQKSEEITDLVKAFVAFHKIVEQPKKDADNPHFKSKYSTLDEIVRVIDKAAPEVGLSYTQWPIATEQATGVATLIFHTSGQYIEYDPLLLPAAKETPQAYGSSQTYARRYTLAAAFGLAAETDDDGNAGSNSKPQSKPQSRPQQQSKPQGQQQTRKDMKQEQSSDAPKATMQQKNQISKEVKELAGIRGTQPAMVFQHLKISDLEAITQNQAKEAINTLAKWFEQANNSNEKQEA